jgi:hypothetical protein
VAHNEYDFVLISMLTLFERAAIPLVTRLFSGAYPGKYSIYAYDTDCGDNMSSFLIPD